MYYKINLLLSVCVRVCAGVCFTCGYISSVRTMNARFTKPLGNDSSFMTLMSVPSISNYEPDICVNKHASIAYVSSP